jgi:hypothetical protein
MAREQKLHTRDGKLKRAENERMAKLCRQHVLREQPGPELAQLMPTMAAQPKPTAADKEEAVGSFGD